MLYNYFDYDGEGIKKYVNTYTYIIINITRTVTSILFYSMDWKYFCFLHIFTLLYEFLFQISSWNHNNISVAYSYNSPYKIHLRPMTDDRCRTSLWPNTAVRVVVHTIKYSLFQCWSRKLRILYPNKTFRFQVASLTFPNFLLIWFDWKHGGQIRRPTSCGISSPAAIHWCTYHTPSNR